MKTLGWIIAGIIIVAVLIGVFLVVGDSNKNNAGSNNNLDNANIDNQEIADNTQTPDTGSSTPKTYNIELKNFAFSPSAISIKIGDKIIWKNSDSARHTVTSDSGDELDSSLFGEGEAYSHTFNQAGTYNYHCAPHPNMKGKVIVS